MQDWRMVPTFRWREEFLGLVHDSQRQLQELWARNSLLLSKHQPCCPAPTSALKKKRPLHSASSHTSQVSGYTRHKWTPIRNISLAPHPASCRHDAPCPMSSGRIQGKKAKKFLPSCFPDALNVTVPVPECVIWHYNIIIECYHNDNIEWFASQGSPVKWVTWLLISSNWCSHITALQTCRLTLSTILCGWNWKPSAILFLFFIQSICHIAF